MKWKKSLLLYFGIFLILINTASAFDWTSSNIIGYWAFDMQNTTYMYNNISGAVAGTSAGTNLVSVTGKINYALYGNNSKAAASPKIALNGTICNIGTSPFTINLWANISGPVVTNNQMFMGSTNPSSPYQGLEMGYTGTADGDTNKRGKLHLGLQNSGGTYNYTFWGNAYVYNDSRFHMYTAVRNGSLYYFYVDGSPLNITASGGSGGTTINVTNSALSNCNLFNNGGTRTESFGGALDEVMIMTEALTQANITELYNGGSGLPYNPIPSNSTINLTVTFNNQSPSNINSTNALYQSTNFSFNYTPYNSSYTLNLSSIYLNYTTNTTTGYFSCINGSCSDGYKQVNYNYNLSNAFYWNRLGDNEIYPGSYNINNSLMYSTNHTAHLLSGSNKLLSIEILNVSNTTKYNYFEVMANYSSNTSSNLQIFYCNSTYNFNSDPITSGNCVLISVLAPNTQPSHTHGIYSYHYVVPFPIVNGNIGAIPVTNTSYFMLYTTSNINGWNVYSINNFSRINAIRTTANNGNLWTSQNYTVDSHIHQFGGAEYFKYSSCGRVNEDNTLYCSSEVTDLIDQSLQPPISPNILTPLQNTTYGINNIVNITWTASNFSGGATINNYTLTLLNENESFYQNITVKNGSTLSYLWNISTIADGIYFIKILANDTNNNTAFGISRYFNFDYLYPRTTADIYIRDELTNLLLNGTNISVILVSTSQTVQNYTTTGLISFSNLTPDNYRVFINPVGSYSPREYAIVIPRTALILNTWLLSNGTNTKFNVKNTLGYFVENATVDFYKFINNSYVAISSANTGVIGSVTLPLQPYGLYRIIINKAPQYSQRLAEIVISETEYNIYLYDNATISFEDALKDITFTTTPLNNNLNQSSLNITFTTNSPLGNIGSFGISNGSASSNVTGSSTGGTVYIPATFSNTRQSKTFYFYLNTTNGEYFNFTKTYYYNNVAPANESIFNFGARYSGQIDPFYRLLLAIFISIVIGLTLLQFVGSAPAMLITMLTFFVFAIIGWVSLLYPLLLAIVIGVGYFAFGGNY